MHSRVCSTCVRLLPSFSFSITVHLPRVIRLVAHTSPPHRCIPADRLLLYNPKPQPISSSAMRSATISARRTDTSPRSNRGGSRASRLPARLRRAMLIVQVRAGQKQRRSATRQRRPASLPALKMRIPHCRHCRRPHRLVLRNSRLQMAVSSPTRMTMACQQVQTHTPRRIFQEEATRLDEASVPTEGRTQVVRSIYPVTCFITERSAAATLGKAARVRQSTLLLQTRPRPTRSRTTRLRTATTAATTAATKVQLVVHRPLRKLVRATRKFTTPIIPARARRAHPTRITTRTTSSVRPCSRAPHPSLPNVREAVAT